GWQRNGVNKPAPIAGYGCCYPATEVLYHIIGKKSGFKPYYLKDSKGRGHWFLKHPVSGRVVDPTVSQFQGKTIPYKKARPCGFLTRNLSKRGQELYQRMKPFLSRQERNAIQL